MKGWPPERVIAALRAPASVAQLLPTELTQLLQQARGAGLLGRIANQVVAAADVPLNAAALEHFTAAQRVCRAQQAEIRREARYLQQALAGLAAPVVLLKGAAYVMTELPAASGRVFGDIDIMVPEAVLGEAEARLIQHGWMTTQNTSYDQRYYRQWMHELPPMQHLQRGTSLDVHHAILPRTARLRPAPSKLFERAQPLAAQPGLHVLAPEDMVLHSMTHLFLNDDTSYALRDLSDLDLLLRHFGRDPGFWAEIGRRAVDLDLVRPLYYGLRHTAAVLGTPIPAAATAAAEAHAPAPWLRPAMDAIWTRVLRTPHAAAAPPGAGLAVAALYLRGHWMRMPLHLLARHLAIKAWMSLQKKAEATPPAAP